ncbi:MAG: phenylalanine--tRNA ligase subunit beta [Alphaproteobacteria bacterium]|nr:phenylalanine--tRNA ligase subunit beta [Alphaproteobacteria bacterium]
MKFTLSWLKDHLETDAAVETIADRLTMIGLEVENLTDKATELAPFTIAKVISAAPHPNADRLQLCMVDTGNGSPVQVVCGAPNARTGLVTVFAAPGTTIPGKGITLSVGVIRGVESRGMLCSAAELGISEDHDGIMELPADAAIGTPYAVWAGLADPVFEINLTPNRQDCTSIHGIARDLAAAGLGQLRETVTVPVEGRFPCPVTVAIEDASLCPAFTLRLVRGVKNATSPEWMRKRLTAIGLRPINALVDITNYMTHDRGRPLHVFDAGKVKGNLVVRRARDGESLRALDGRDYALDSNVCIIADDSGVESLGGIMGAEASGCDEATTDVLIESALWNEINIAQTGRRLAIHSDARYRFERGVDPAFTVPGLDLATQMVIDICGGTPSKRVLVGSTTPPPRVIAFPLSEIRRLTGIEVPRASILRILADLGFMVEAGKSELTITVPSWRSDVHGKSDIVEEIIRIFGVDNVPETAFERGADGRRPVLKPLQLRSRRARRTLASRGMVEAVTWSFIAKPAARLFGGGGAELELANPIAAELSDMRPSLLPGLIAAAQANADRGFGDLALFELGEVFTGDQPKDQLLAAAGLRRGFATPAGMGRHWSGSVAASPFDVKADALAALAAAAAPMAGLQIAAASEPWLHPGRSGVIRIGKAILGWFGEMHPRALETLRADGPLMVFEVFLDRIPEGRRKTSQARAAIELWPFHPVSRDFAFIVDHSVSAADIQRMALAVDRKLITDVTVFDVYEGKGIAEGSKSIAIAVTLQPREKTLTDLEIDAVAAKIIGEITRKTGGSLRS